MTGFRTLPGLPPYGENARPFPPDWGRFGREGTVVEFTRSDGQSWIGNFEPGYGNASQAVEHPDGRHVLVLARGDLWSVDPDRAQAELVTGPVNSLWPVRSPPGFIAEWQGLAFFRIDAAGILWHTRRLSWDGFDSVEVSPTTLTGLGWSPIEDRWMPFAVNISTGESTGGSFGEDDSEGWERLAFAPMPPNDR
jgi:hypothetical protein